MCRLDATHQTHVQDSQSEKCDTAVVAATKQEPNLPDSNIALNPNHTLSVFLLDWDDTLCPTTALTALGPERLSEALKVIDNVVAELLSAALAFPRSRVIILTNATLSWVYHSAESFLPKVNDIIRAQDSQLTLMSAKSADLPEVGSPAYEEVVRRAKSDAVRPLSASLQELVSEWQVESLQVIAFGDQPHDLAAAHTLRGLMCVEESFIKTVLMKPQPTIIELGRQLGILCRSMPRLRSSARSFHQSMYQVRTPSSPQCGPVEAPAAPAMGKAETEDVVRNVIASIPTPLKNAALRDCTSTACSSTPDVNDTSATTPRATVTPRGAQCQTQPSQRTRQRRVRQHRACA